MSNLYLVHASREWKTHKYVSKKRGKNGKWIYTYNKLNKSTKDKLLGGINGLSDTENKIQRLIIKANRNEAKGVSNESVDRHLTFLEQVADEQRRGRSGIYAGTKYSK